MGDRYQYEINISVEKALSILSEATKQTKTFLLCAQDASPTLLEEAKEIQRAMDSVKITSLIDQGSLPFIEVSKESIYLHFGCLYNQSQKMQNQYSFVSHAYDDYYQAIRDALKKINISIPESLSVSGLIRMNPKVDIKHFVAYKEAVARCFNAYKVELPPLDLDLAQTKITKALSTLNAPPCKLVHSSVTHSYSLQFSDAVSDNKARRYFYLLESTLGLRGEFFNATRAKEDNHLISAATIYLTDINDLLSQIDRFLSKPHTSSLSLVGLFAMDESSEELKSPQLLFLEDSSVESEEEDLPLLDFS